MTDGVVRARGAAMAAALAPLLIWPLGPGQLLHPWPAATAALGGALLAATAPARGLHLVAWLQLLLLPSTLAWTAAVADTGVGPSLASVESLTAGAHGEVLGATGLALRTPAFHVVAMPTLSSTLRPGSFWRCSCRWAWPR